MAIMNTENPDLIEEKTNEAVQIFFFYYYYYFFFKRLTATTKVVACERDYYA